MNGKVCMITGASSGIGKEMAIAIARMGATVVIVCRNNEKGEAARAEIVKASGNDKVELFVGDLSAMKDVRAVAEAFRKSHDRLHILMNNAGTVKYNRTLTVDGIEMQFAVNHLAPFLLTYLLLDTIKASRPSRIVITASGLHARETLDFENFQGERSYKGMRQYGTTKLMNILFCYELARRLEGTGVTVNCYSPGFTNTGLGREFPAGMRFVMRIFGKSPRKGARTGIFLATSPDVDGVSGKYFFNEKAAGSSTETHDKAKAERLWKMSEQMTGLAATR